MLCKYFLLILYQSKKTVMKPLFTYVVAIFLLTLAGEQAYAQTYTFDNTRPNCDGTWNNSDCWEKVDFPSCTNSTAQIPPTTPLTNCQVNIVINGELTFGGNLVFGGNFNSLTVNSGAVFTITGDVTIQSLRSINFVTNGGRINIQGASGIIFQSGTKSGNTVNLTRLNISGNNFGSVNTTNIQLSNYTELNINTGGTLISSGPTSYSGQEIDINVNGGFFRTASLSIAGNQNRLNTSNNATVVIDGDVKFVGNDSGLDVRGNSEIEIGGNVQTQPNSSFKIEDGSVVRMCGTGVNSPSNEELEELERTLNITIGNCRILPVEYLFIKAAYLKESRSSNLVWATAKEWESSHFEIERSTQGLNFQKIGEIQAVGYKDTRTDYEFVDEFLPLSGGNILYRIKQVDLDGSYSYSKVLSVRAQGIEFTSGTWRAYPNPTTGESLKIGLLDRGAYQEEALSFRIIHPMYITASTTVGSEEELNQLLSVQASKIPKGVFVVEIQWGQKIEHIKVLKQ